MWDEALDHAVRIANTQKQNENKTSYADKANSGPTQGQETTDLKTRTAIITVTPENQDKRVTPPPTAELIHLILTRKFKLNDCQQNKLITALYTPNPSDQWNWEITFRKQQTRDELCDKTKHTETMTYRRHGNEYTYEFNIEPEELTVLITMDVTPKITDEQIRQKLELHGEVMDISRNVHGFANYIDSGRRKILIKPDGLVKELPWTMVFKDGVKRKLHYKGKSFYCTTCQYKHTYEEGHGETDDESDSEDETSDKDKQKNKNQTETQNEQAGQNWGPPPNSTRGPP